jgi:hypothetical protein
LDNEEDSTNKKETKSNNNPLESKSIHGDSLLSPRIFTDDASEIIGRLFFGPAPPGAAGQSGSSKGGKGIVSSPSFGSTSTLSTMTSTKGRTAHGPPPQGGDTQDNLFPEDDNGVVEEENLQVIGWDQDEIDLWTNHTETKDEVKEEMPTDKRVQDDWVSQRRRLLELQKKRRNWDELGPGVSLTTQLEAKTFEGGTFDMPSIDIIVAQNILKATQTAQHQIRDASSNLDVQDEEQPKRKGGGAVIVDDGKQHWMPDSLCKQCYACEAPFTLLRRKHHCRLCGMIFW